MSTYERLTRLQPFDHLLNQSKLNPDNIAIDGPMGPITYRKLYERAKKYSSFLSARGIKQGDLVALRVLNADTVPVLFACWSLGATTAIFPWPLDDENRENFDWLISLENETDFPVTHFIHLSGEARDAVSRESIISEPVEFAPGQPIHAIFSSGTTGKPKGVPFELELLEARAWNARRIWMPELPFFSLIGMTSASGFFAMYSAISNGDAYLYPTTGEHNVKVALKHGVGTIKGSPPQLMSLALYSRESKIDLPALRYVESAGGYLAPKIAETIRAVFPNTEVRNLYGSTEGGTIIASPIPADVSSATFWPLLPNALVEIVDDEDRPLSIGESGRVRIRNLPMANRYLNNREATEQAFGDDWFYPGDIGALSTDGALQLQGRASEVINMSGVKLDPAEIDLWLLEQEGVIDAAAFGYKLPSGAVALGLALVLVPNFDRKGFIQKFQARFYGIMPNAVLGSKQIPRNELGKVLRRQLAADVEQKLGKQ